MITDCSIIRVRRIVTRSWSFTIYKSLSTGREWYLIKHKPIVFQNGRDAA